jgi:hypothetical protein
VVLHGQQQLPLHTGLLRSGGRVKLVVALHGCMSDNKFVGDRFARESHLNQYADTNNPVILYSQTDISLLRGNPQGCWNWWGYAGSDYAQKSGPRCVPS